MPRDLRENQIKDRLRKYLAGKLTLREFSLWFVPLTWDLEDDAPVSLRKLVFGAELLMAEYTGGYRTEVSLRAKLSELADPERVRFVRAVKATSSPAGVEPPASEPRPRSWSSNRVLDVFTSWSVEGSVTLYPVGQSSDIRSEPVYG